MKVRRQLAQGKLTMEQAEIQAKPFLDKMNAQAAKNAQEKDESYTPLTLSQFLAVWLEVEKRQ